MFMSARRVLFLATCLAIAPVSYETLQTLRSVWSSDGEAGGAATKFPETLDGERARTLLTIGPDGLRAQSDAAATLPVGEFLRRGFVPPTASKISAPPWDRVNQSVLALTQRRQALDIAAKHVGRKALGSLQKEELLKFAAELEPAVVGLPALQDWPPRLREMSIEREKTAHISEELVTIERELTLEVSGGNPISTGKLSEWSQALASLERPVPGSPPLDQYPLLLEQVKQLKRRCEFWNHWNPPWRLGALEHSGASTLSQRRLKFAELARSGGPRPDPRYPEEAEHIRRVSAEVLRLADEELFFTFKERLESKKAPRPTVAEFFEQLEPIVAKGLHLKESQAIFKAFVSQGIPQKTWVQPAVRLFDFHLPGEKIWLAHWDEKLELQDGRWIVPYDPVKKRPIKADQRFLYQDSGFLEFRDPPEEVRIVKEFNAAHQEWQENLGDQDEWKKFQQTCSNLSERLAKYYRQMSRFWDRADDGKLRLAPGLEFATDQTLISEVLEHWNIVEGLYGR